MYYAVWNAYANVVRTEDCSFISADKVEADGHDKIKNKEMMHRINKLLLARKSSSKTVK